MRAGFTSAPGVTFGFNVFSLVFRKAAEYGCLLTDQNFLAIVCIYRSGRNIESY